jgi:5-hydroxyisourate hydrolase-like protein (transthyretin family)
LPRKRIIKVIFRMLVLAILLTALLILPQHTMFTASSAIQLPLSVFPTYIQEGSETNINVSVLEGQPNLTYVYTLDVTAPDDAHYNSSVTVVTSGLGTGSSYKRFWSDFPSANTNLAGYYRIILYDESETVIDIFGFTVGLTDRTEYLQSENVMIHGSGYDAKEMVLVDLRFSNASISGFPRIVNANAEGVVTDSWNIPSNATLGVYTVSLFNATTTAKPISDIQLFKVGVKCEVLTTNLAGENLAEVKVDVYNATTGSFIIFKETNETGWTKFILTPSDYTFKATWKEVEVCSVTKTITENMLLPLTVNLSNIKLIVKDENSVALPFIDLTLKYNITDVYGRTFSDAQSFTTNLEGIVQVKNLFAYIDYIIEASRDGFLFNTTLINNLPAGWNDITIIAPMYNVSVKVPDSKDAPATGLTVEAYAWSGGISGDPLQVAQTDSVGCAYFSLIAGKYRLRLFFGTTFLNEATVDLQNQSSVTIQCNIYNADLNVFIADFLGQPIPNVSVEFQRKNDSDYQTMQTKTTSLNGVASFSNIIGGDSRITASWAGRTSKTEYLYLTGPTKDVVFKLDGYVMVFGYFLETIHFVTLIILILLIIVLIVALNYKRLLRLLQTLRK